MDAFGAVVTLALMAVRIDAQNIKDPLFSVQDANGHPCLLASLQTAVTIHYKTTGLDRVRSDSMTRYLTNSFYMPETVTSEGDCSEDDATLSLSWDNGNYTLQFSFQSNHSETNASSLSPIWYASKISLSFLTGPGTDNPEIAKGGEHTVSTAEGTSHMAAPYNFSYQCKSQENIEMHEYTTNGTVDLSVVDYVEIGIYNVKMQVGALTSNSTFGTDVQCLHDLSFGVSKQHIVTVAIAACLASTILIIVVAHAIIKSRTKLHYASMN